MIECIFKELLDDDVIHSKNHQRRPSHHRCYTNRKQLGPYLFLLLNLFSRFWSTNNLLGFTVFIQCYRGSRQCVTVSRWLPPTSDVFWAID
jgi:hypothetical protein